MAELLTSTEQTLLLAQEILGACQRSGGYSAFIDAEGTLDCDRADLFGLQLCNWEDEQYQEETAIKEETAYNTPKGKDKAVKAFLSKTIDENKNFVCLHTPSIEQMFDGTFNTFIEAVEEERIPKNVVIGVDSLSSLPSETELTNDLADATYGTSRAKQMSTGFRKYIKALNKNNISVVFVDQTRDSIGIGKNNKVSGGNALKFYASTRIWLNNPKRIFNKHEQTIGVEIDFIVEKNKVAPPFRTGKLCVLFDIGIDNVRANINWLLENTKNIESTLKQAGSWFSWGEKKAGQGLDKTIMFFEENDLEKELEDEVIRVWNILYESPKRKKRYE